MLLWGVGLVKIGIAAGHGHHNVGFPSLAMALAVVPLLFALLARRTSAGDRALTDLQTLFEGLKHRIGGLRPASNDFALLAGVFGVAALAGAPAAAYAKTLFPPAPSSGGGGGGDSSCSSSCGSSCGGGGGCGGCSS